MPKLGSAIGNTQSLDGDPCSSLPEHLELVVVGGPDARKRIRVGYGLVYVGKDPTSDLVLTDPTVSFRHLELNIAAQFIEARDLGSKNGCYFEGARFDRLRIDVAAVISVGSTRLTLVEARGDELISPAGAADRFGGLLGGSPSMRDTFARLKKAAASDSTVLIQGETGTGKELCAEALHRHSARAGKPYVVCDLGSISPSLIESELFGHVRGAFTGADRSRDGAFQTADGGTLLLDEVGELDLQFQPRLLRVLERREVRPVGSNTYRRLDVRVIAATHRNLAELVKEGRFRADLFHRLSVIALTVPPLRLHKEDIPMLVGEFCAPHDVTVPQATLDLLLQYDWPGNVRELRNVVERALAFRGESRTLTPSLLILGPDGVERAEPGTTAPIEQFHEAKERLIAAWERDFVRTLLQRVDGNVTRAARETGVDRVHLHRLLRKHGLGGG